MGGAVVRPLHREITSTHVKDGELATLANEVLDVVRKTVDRDAFSAAYSKLAKRVNETREGRKRKLAVQAVTDADKFALRKQKKNLDKREQRKRKLHAKKPSLRLKKFKPSNNS